MEFSLEYGHIVEAMIRHWVSLLLIVVSLVTILTTSIVRWWWKRRYLRLIDESFAEENELDELPPLGSRDREALDLIKRYRKSVWDMPESELEITVTAISRHAMGIVQPIAAIYFPDAEEPEYEASLAESLHLVRRVSSRLARLAAVAPFSLVGNRKLGELQRYYQVYRKINDSPILQLLKRHQHIYKVARWALNVKNLANPFYWAGREISREGYFFMLRWFYMAVAGQVGREVMRLYSGRRFQREDERDAVLICHRLFALTAKWEGPSTEEWAALVDFVSGLTVLEPEIKIHVLSRWSRNRLPENLEDQVLQTEAGKRWYRRGLKRLMETGSRGNPERERFIKDELAALEEMEVAVPTPREPEDDGRGGEDGPSRLAM